MNSIAPFHKPRILSFDAVVFILIVTVLLLAAPAFGRNLYSSQSLKSSEQKLTTEPCSQGLIHDAGRMALAVDNLGCIGLGLVIFIEPITVPSCQYPYPSN